MLFSRVMPKWPRIHIQPRILDMKLGEDRLGETEMPDAAVWARERLGFEADENQRELLSAGGHRVIVNCTRQWGKSTVAAAKAVHHAFFRAGSTILVLSPAGRQSGEFVRKAEDFVRALGIEPKGDGNNDMSIELPNRSRIIGLPGVERTIRGFSAVSLMMIDEASRVEDELYYAVMPMLAVGNGDLWMMSTPRGKRGFFHRTWSETSGRWKKMTVQATDCPRISPDFLEEQRELMDEAFFRQEFLCEFVDVEHGLFDGDSLAAAVNPSATRLWR